MRGSEVPRLTPMGINYDTVGELLHGAVARLCARWSIAVGEEKVFCGDPALQISLADFGFSGAKPVICLKTALAAFESIVMQGEGAPRDMMGSHFQRFLSVREELLDVPAQAPGLRAGVSGGDQSGAAPAAASGGARVDRRRRGECTSSTWRTPRTA